MLFPRKTSKIVLCQTDYKIYLTTGAQLNLEVAASQLSPCSYLLGVSSPKYIERSNRSTQSYRLGKYEEVNFKRPSVFFRPQFL